MALGCIWDPQALAFCAEAGLGARFALRIGGKTGPASGTPLDALITVRGLREDHDQAGLGAARSHLGRSAWIACEGDNGAVVDVVLCSERSQTFSPEAFDGLGIALEGKQLAVVKSSNHFRNLFAPVAARIVSVATPGAIQMDFAAIIYRRRRPEPYYPRVPAPLFAA